MGRSQDPARSRRIKPFFSGRFEIWGFPKYNLIYTVPVYRYIIVYIYIYMYIFSMFDNICDDLAFLFTNVTHMRTSVLEFLHRVLILQVKLHHSWIITILPTIVMEHDLIVGKMMSHSRSTSHLTNYNTQSDAPGIGVSNTQMKK